MAYSQTETIEFAQDIDLVAGLPEGSHVDDLVRSLLLAFGEDPEREGLRRTPERVARMYQELLAGYQTDPAVVVNDALFASDYQGMVLVRDIEFFSLCEHHLLPFFGRAHVAYLPDGRVLGLSKIPRLVEMYARRLQIQEQMTQQIGQCLQEVTAARGVAVIVEGTHMCAMMRGVRQAHATMVTRALTGAFLSDAALRSELSAQVGAGQ